MDQRTTFKSDNINTANTETPSLTAFEHFVPFWKEQQQLYYIGPSDIYISLKHIRLNCKQLD